MSTVITYRLSATSTWFPARYGEAIVQKRRGDRGPGRRPRTGIRMTWSTPGDRYVAAAPNRFAVGMRIRSRRIAPTRTKLNVFVPAKFWALTTRAAETLR